MISVKAIKPHTPFTAKPFTDAIRAETKLVAADMKKDFEKTTRTWKHKVVFTARATETNGTATATVSTKDEIYGYVDEGTRAHVIRPKRAKRLAFQSKYKSKTTPHVIGSHQGGSSGKQVFSKVVHHPGTDPRYFARDIQAIWQPKLSKRIQTAINKAAKQSGHSVK